MLEMRNGLEQDLDRDRSAGADCWGRDETAFMLAAPGGNSPLLQLKIANIKIQPTEMISVIICAKLFLTNANCLALAWEIFSRLFLIVAGVDTGTDMSTLSSGAANNDLSTHNNNLRHQILQTMGTLLQPGAVNHSVPAYLSYLLSPWFYMWTGEICVLWMWVTAGIIAFNCFQVQDSDVSLSDQVNDDLDNDSDAVMIVTVVVNLSNSSHH